MTKLCIKVKLTFEIVPNAPKFKTVCPISEISQTRWQYFTKKKVVQALKLLLVAKAV